MSLTQDQLKRNVADVACQLTQAWLGPDDILGVGTGSTVNCFIEALASSDLKIRGAFSSSEASTRLLEGIGIEVFDANCGERAALYVDGADEVDANGAVTKGGGGALTREKIVASLSDSFVCMVDESKLVERLGGFPLPVEVIPMAKSHVASEIVRLGGEPIERQDFTTDNGNVILDVSHLDVEDAANLECSLNNIPGVVENGIFWANRPSLTLVACDCGVETRGSEEALQQHHDKLQAVGSCCQSSYSAADSSSDSCC